MRPKAAVASTTDSAIKGTKHAVHKVRSFMKEHKQQIKAVAKDIKDLGDKVTDAGLVVAATAVFTEGVTATPGVQLAAIGEVTGWIGDGINIATM